jgi:spermidine synthase
VKPYEKLATAEAPDGSVLTLYRHDGAYLIRVNSVELMSTRRFLSEDRLAEVACMPFAATPGVVVLVGGLGFGFTMKAALRVLADDARVVVVEIMRDVIEWNQHPDYTLSREALLDTRVDLRHDDVANVLRAHPATFDAIMLDVDNGADALTTNGNALLYKAAGVKSSMAALRPGGRLVYWSATPDPRFVTVLERAGLTVRVERSRAHGTTGGYHTLISATLS